MNHLIGNVFATINCSILAQNVNQIESVLNGIAYEPNQKKIYLTGKNWSKLYQVEVVN